MSSKCHDEAASAKPIDVWIGNRVARLRTQRGYTIAELAAILEVSEEEYKLLEGGAVRIAARQLLELGRALECPIEEFFHDIDLCNVSDARQAPEPTEDMKQQLSRLSRIFTMITKDEEREYIIRLAAGFAAEKDKQERRH